MEVEWYREMEARQESVFKIQFMMMDVLHSNSPFTFSHINFAVLCIQSTYQFDDLMMAYLELIPFTDI